jgi:hypothetical protein
MLRSGAVSTVRSSMMSSSSKAKVLLLFFLAGLVSASINLVPLTGNYLRGKASSLSCGPVFAAGLAAASSSYISSLGLLHQALVTLELF